MNKRTVRDHRHLAVSRLRWWVVAKLVGKDSVMLNMILCKSATGIVCAQPQSKHALISGVHLLGVTLKINEIGNEHV